MKSETYMPHGKNVVLVVLVVSIKKTSSCLLKNPFELFFLHLCWLFHLVPEVEQY